MEDRELLELAAKAVDHGSLVDRFGRFCGSFNRKPGCKNEFGDPLNDDGDALRLAVKLKMDIAISVGVQVSWWENESLNWVNEPVEDVRRAIVRAAAEIGRSMP